MRGSLRFPRGLSMIYVLLDAADCNVQASSASIGEPVKVAPVYDAMIRLAPDGG